MRPEAPKSRSGFTLIELLVVIAIIGVLVALLLPAVQKVREAASRTKCQNSLKQWTLAMHMYHDSNQMFPYGKKGTPRTLWVVLLWPYVEQNALYSRYDFTVGFHQPPNCIANDYTGLITQPIPLYVCPSNKGVSPITTNNQFYRVKGNYVINWGPIYEPYLSPSPAGLRAPFGFTVLNPGDNGFNTTPPLQTRLTDITDGTSSTMLMSEVLMIENNTITDRRGDVMNDAFGASVFQTFDTPNAGIDAINAVNVCQNTPPLLPCQVAANGHIAARSQHPGGVMVSFADGSVQFVTNAIRLATWQNLSTINDGQVASLDQ